MSNHCKKGRIEANKTKKIKNLRIAWKKGHKLNVMFNANMLMCVY